MATPTRVALLFAFAAHLRLVMHYRFGHLELITSIVWISTSATWPEVIRTGSHFVGDTIQTASKIGLVFRLSPEIAKIQTTFLEHFTDRSDKFATS
jgi:hypothetical protein